MVVARVVGCRVVPGLLCAGVAVPIARVWPGLPWCLLGVCACEARWGHRAGFLRVSGGSVRVSAGRVCVQLLGLNLSQPARVIPGLRVSPGLWNCVCYVIITLLYDN